MPPSGRPVGRRAPRARAAEPRAQQAPQPRKGAAPAARPKEPERKPREAPRRGQEPQRKPPQEPEPERAQAPRPAPVVIRSRRRIPVSWKGLLLLMVPLTLVLDLVVHAPPLAVFLAACLGVVPLAGYMGEATEHLSARTGPAIATGA